MKPNPTAIYTVSQLCRESRILIENHFFEIQIEGELSNLARPASGHLYFTLKDHLAQVQCAMFRPRMRGIRFKPENGQQVVLRARVSLYEQRGNFQLIVEHMEPAGDGALRLAYERLKLKLDQEGLFDAARKQAIPSLPRQIGVITSPSGAVIRDILTVLKRRFPAIPVLIYPVAVQGEAAKTEIVSALNLAQQRDECDVLVLARGGGSLEDLWAFNEESVARAIADCTIPTVSAIGHEVDITIADLVADQRAPTPSAAAELISPDRLALSRQLTSLHRTLSQRMQRQLEQRQQSLDWTIRHLQRLRPDLQLKQRHLALDNLSQRLNRALSAQQAGFNQHLAHLNARLHQHNPAQRLAQWHRLIEQFQHRLHQSMHIQIERQKKSLGHLGHQLQLVSPLSTLQRGYSITEDVESGAILRHSAEVQAGQSISTRLSQGRLISRVERIE